MKLCPKCNLTKPVTDFAKNIRAKDGLQRLCRSCNNALGMANYHANKERYFAQAKKRDVQLDELINSYKSQPCADCGQNYPPYVMDFDHVSGEKILKISTMRRRRMAFKTIIAEIEKCEVVCANCHRERTHGVGAPYQARYMD